MAPFDNYKVDSLFLLVGTNPLPNYVAARVLLRQSQDSRIFLVYSAETDPVRAALESVLKPQYCANVISIQVEEANPASIRNKITEYASGLSGRVGLHYTGGTKAMSVYSYLALEALTRPDPHDRNHPTLEYIQYSYLDARTLSMVIVDSSGSYPSPIPIENNCSLKIDELLGLHSRNVSLKREPFWPHVAAALLDVHTDVKNRKCWQQWVAQSFFREPECPLSGLSEDDWRRWVLDTFVVNYYERRRWKTNKQAEEITMDWPSLPPTIREAFIEELGEPLPANLRELMKNGSFKKAEELGKWLEGGWLETFVMQQVQAIHTEKLHILEDIARDIQAHIELKLPKDEILKQEVQIDVAFTRGYQLFILSCTAADEKGLCKSKLLEAAIRAEQLGGAEARVGLVCCYDKPKELEKEVADLLGKRIRVFGRDDLRNLKDFLADWIH